MHCEIALACVLQPRISKDRAELAKKIDSLSSNIPVMEGEAATGADIRQIDLPPQPEEGAKCDEIPQIVPPDGRRGARGHATIGRGGHR